MEDTNKANTEVEPIDDLIEDLGSGEIESDEDEDELDEDIFDDGEELV